MLNLLILTDELNYSDGVTSHLFYLLTELKKTNKLAIFLMYSGGDSGKRFIDSGINVLENKFLSHQNRSIKNFTRIILNVFNFSKKNKINIIHSHNHYAANIGHRVSKLISVRTIQTIHGLIPEAGRLSHFNAGKFISVSEPIVGYILKNKISSKENVKLIRHGVPLIENLKSKDVDCIKILCASRLVYEKGVDIFIRAVKIVANKCKGKAEFMIAGTGIYENELKSLCKDLGVEVTFLGNVKNIIELLMDTHIFVMPSRIKSEGFPMSIVEAGFTKNLIISSRFDSLDYFFKNGTDGLTFEINNYVELASKIIFALENPGEVNQMRENFYNEALKLFNVQNSAGKHLELYRECLSQ
ncbi:MAG: glycosyltransferase family 4 protein [bacterium]